MSVLLELKMKFITSDILANTNGCVIMIKVPSLKRMRSQEEFQDLERVKVKKFHGLLLLLAVALSLVELLDFFGHQKFTLKLRRGREEYFMLSSRRSLVTWCLKKCHLMLVIMFHNPMLLTQILLNLLTIMTMLHLIELPFSRNLSLNNGLMQN